MSIFVQKLNPITGINDWVVQQEDYDFHQEVARSSFADMLHDTERNQKYEKALKSAIELMHSKGKAANVLDIGTGTGLLSMMAVKHGADLVIACEAFKPMSECAKKLISRNGFQDKIKVIPKRSTALTVGSDGDLKNKCNILVTEVFDTELIGEGALSTFSHAHKVLLEKDCLVIPHSATVYAQIAESSFVQNWNKVKDICDNNNEDLITVPTIVKECAGSAAVHDIQLNELDLTTVKFLTEPIPVFEFDWSGSTPLIMEESKTHTIKTIQNGLAQVVFMWWDLQMDFENKIILSCAPHWAHILSKNNPKSALPWRDHWMQAVYYLPKEINCSKGENINFVSCHDEYSLWFCIEPDFEKTKFIKPICQCALHVTFSRTRIGQLNDNQRNIIYPNLLKKYINSDSVLLILSDGFYLSLYASKLGARKLYFVETNYLSRKILADFINYNNIKNVEIFENIKAMQSCDSLEKINIVIGEPYFLSSILPWDNLLFIYLLEGVRNLLTDDVNVFPKFVTIKGIVVKFYNLNKIRLPLGQCEGFAMKEFDDLIEASSNISDDNVEAQPLWEYPGVALSKIVDILTIDISNVPEKTIETSGVFQIEKNDSCNGIALWVEWLHEGNKENVISSGPIVLPEIGEQIQWDVHTKQGVCLFPDRITSHINYTFKFDFNEGNISFKWK